MWNIVSAGPSRHTLEPKHFLKGGQVVAINGALDIRERLHVDTWAFADHINLLPMEKLKPLIKPPLTVWVGANRFLEMFWSGSGYTQRCGWELEFDLGIGFRCMDRGLLMDPFTNNHRAAFSLIYVLEKCMALGAKTIRLLSADMSGPWHPDCLTEEASRAINRWDRWRYERAQVQRMMQLAKDKRDVDIHVYTPDDLKGE